MFQSAPDPKAGRNTLPLQLPSLLDVSIRSRLGGREKPCTHRCTSQFIKVSIRSRLGGREKRAAFYPGGFCRCFNPLPTRRSGETDLTTAYMTGYEFQSAPDSEVGRNAKPSCVWPMPTSFNPLPTRRSGETGVSKDNSPVLVVSIRSRLGGREKRFVGAPLVQLHHVSIRSRLGGREKRTMPPTAAAGATCFNPLPTRRSGETIGKLLRAAGWKVSIRSRLGGREKLRGSVL